MAEVPTIHEALIAARADIGAVGKNERYEGGRTKYNFRGVDTVINACSPVFLKHRINTRPHVQDIRVDTYSTSGGTVMNRAIVKVQWEFEGPAGDKVYCEVFGEAADAGDKSVTQAQSVAQRIAYLEALNLPTDSPEPDMQVHERVAAAPKPAPLGEAQQQVLRVLDELPEDQKAALRAWWTQEAKLPVPTQLTEEQAERVLVKVVELGFQS